MSTTASDHQKLWDLIKGIKFGMFTHRHANGMMHSQPLTTMNKSMDEGDKLYFFVSRDSDVVKQLAQDDNVNVSYTSPSDDSYVSVSGKALLVEDMGKKEALWSPMAKAWFPGGPTDPALALVQVRISHAEYWDVKESKMVQVAKMVTAAITGTPPVNMGEHKELRMP
jgi:general stress protein 26